MNNTFYVVPKLTHWDSLQALAFDVRGIDGDKAIGFLRAYASLEDVPEDERDSVMVFRAKEQAGDTH